MPEGTKISRIGVFFPYANISPLAVDRDALGRDNIGRFSKPHFGKNKIFSPLDTDSD